jgi:F-type H+-transporting ATPase subunit b
MSFDAEFWVAAAFAIFLAVLAYLNTHRRVLAALDKRGSVIRQDISEARRLKEEAESVLAQSYRTHQNVGREIQAIIDGAEAEAKQLAAEESIESDLYRQRKTRLARSRIAQTEMRTLKDLRAAAAEAAVAAAEDILTRSRTKRGADRQFALDIEALKLGLSKTSAGGSPA